MSKQKVTFSLNIPKFGRAVSKSEGLKKALKDKADEIAWRCGEGYVATAKIGNLMALAEVHPETKEAKRDNSDNNTLLKSLY